MSSKSNSILQNEDDLIDVLAIVEEQPNETPELEEIDVQSTETKPTSQQNEPTSNTGKDFENGDGISPENGETVFASDTFVEEGEKEESCKRDIVLGIQEADYLRSLAKELLSLGKNILSQVGSTEERQPFENCKSDFKVERSQNTSKYSSIEENKPVTKQASNEVANIRTSEEFPKTVEQPTEISKELSEDEKLKSELEKFKQDFISAFTQICDSIGKVKTKQESLAAPSDLENTIPDSEEKSNDVTQQNALKETSKSTERYMEAIDKRMALFDTKLAELDSYSVSIMKTVLKHNEILTNKLLQQEKGVLQMVKKLQELQCAVGLQMHFGNLNLDQQPSLEAPAQNNKSGKKSDERSLYAPEDMQRPKGSQGSQGSQDDALPKNASVIRAFRINSIDVLSKSHERLDEQQEEPLPERLQFNHGGFSQDGPKPGPSSRDHKSSR